MACVAEILYSIQSPLAFWAPFLHPEVEGRCDARGEADFRAVDGLLTKARLQRLCRSLSRQLSCAGILLRDQFLTMAFAQLTYRESLRDIETCLSAVPEKLYHPAFAARFLRSTLGMPTNAETGACGPTSLKCSSVRARTLYAQDDFGVALKHAAYALDSTTIDLCLALFPGLAFVATRGGQAAHADRLAGQYPLFCSHNSRENARCDRARSPAHRAGSLLHDGQRIHRLRSLVCLHSTDGVFHHPCQAESRLHAPRIPRVDKSTGLRSDQTIVLQGPKTSHLYPTPLRRVAYYDAEHERRLVFLTNNFELSRLSPLLNSNRLSLASGAVSSSGSSKTCGSSVLCHSINAVKTQVWIA